MDGRVLRGDRTRAAVLDRAMAMATEAGLDGLSLGQLAEALGVSKSGLFAHWKSKEDLQLATIDHAREVWAERVIMPALSAPRGVRRLWALHQSRVDYYAANTLPGGCFFANANFEFNARPGAVRDRLAEGFTAWMRMLTRLASEAIAEGEMKDVDPEQLDRAGDPDHLLAVAVHPAVADEPHGLAEQVVQVGVVVVDDAGGEPAAQRDGPRGRARVPLLGESVHCGPQDPVAGLFPPHGQGTRRGRTPARRRTGSSRRASSGSRWLGTCG